MLTILWLHGLSIQDYVGRRATRVWRALAYGIGRCWWKLLPFPVAAGGHAALYYLMFKAWPLRRTNNRVARVAQKFLLGSADVESYGATWQRKRAIESAMNHGSRNLLAMLERCGQELHELSKQARELHGRPVIFTPLHFTSDVAATVICGLASQRSVYAVSIYSIDDFSPLIVEWLAERGVAVRQVYPVGQPQHLRTAIKSVRKFGVGMIIYPDALPQLTQVVTAAQMPVREATLFGRPGLLHSGVGDVASLCNAVVLPFYLTWQHGRLELEAFQAFSFDPNRMDACIEASVRNRPSDWLLWHYPSLFYFNSAATRSHENQGPPTATHPAE